MTAMDLHGRLSALVKTHGVSLLSGGSRERGLPRDAAISVVDILIDCGYPVFGVEVWREVATGHSIDSLSGWYSQSDQPHISALEARAFLAEVRLGKHDVVTIQSSVPL